MYQGEEVPHKKHKPDSDGILVEKVDSAHAAPCSNPTLPSTSVLQRPKILCKNTKFSYFETCGKRFVWKSLKQIITQERSLIWPDDIILYNSLNAPPSLKPPKKYSDISGLHAPYTDPQTRLHYHNSDEFRIIRTLPSDIVQGYLALRGATNIVG
ncbi:INO80 complex subunit C [Stomoxys calcitrans]|uniref:Vps72/YL1 C-terminal domain-containing protein n=1 Tax=Stomoxys calcitrans TaxID=35570 RepID=A0A1I8PPF9_STOCA|nr:INO80 complex subunit C [Stomoxys calcitrans]